MDPSAHKNYVDGPLSNEALLRLADENIAKIDKQLLQQASGAEAQNQLATRAQVEEGKKAGQIAAAAVGKNGQIKSNINLSFNNSFNTSFATNNNNNGAASIDQKPPSRTPSANVSP